MLSILGMLSFAEHLNLLERLNTMRVGSGSLTDVFIFRTYSLWSFFQQHMWSEIRSWSPQKQGTPPPMSLKDWLLRYAALCISLFSCAWLVLRRPRNALYTVDITVGDFKNDPRLHKVYEVLYKQRESFFEIIHGRMNGGLIRRFFSRRRPVIYLEGIDVLFGWLKSFRLLSPVQFPHIPIDAERFNASETPLVAYLIQTYKQKAQLSVYRILFLERVFRMVGTVRVLSIDDIRNFHEVIAAARGAHIPSLVFQHGRFNRHLVGWRYVGIDARLCVMPDRYVVWNQFWREQLMSLSPLFALHAERILIGGSPHKTHYVPMLGTTNGAELHILIPFEPQADRKEVSSYILALLQDPAAHIYFKVRPDASAEDQLRGLSDAITQHPRFACVQQLTPATLATINVVLGSYSTFLYEMVEAQKPVGVLQMQSTQAQDLVEAELAQLVSVSDIVPTVRALAELPQDVLARRSSVLRSVDDLHSTLPQILETVT